ncbi:DUF1765-domain-containing protein [Trichodelitschia bisporula]|uniref:DUF1765-domain-containing protein n=1 Tax=Trichodelitschia bisporula TaxID=703511 RepID=A0A6G1HJG4_9PEZI|nr:DUF1765-domain-containing protein [Trichodelitschia bisporula]
MNLPRAASYTYLPSVQNSLFKEPETVTIKDLFPESNERGRGSKKTVVAESGYGSATPTDPNDEKVEARLTTLRQDLPKIVPVSSIAGKTEPASVPVLPQTPGRDDSSEPSPRASRTLSSRLRRRSWLPNSRSPSPRKSSMTSDDSPVEPPGSSWSFGSSRRSATRNTIIEGDETASRSRSSSLSRHLSKKLKKQRPLSTIADTMPSGVPTRPSLSATNIHKSFSSDRLTTPSSFMRSADSVPPMPRLDSRERFHKFKAATRKKDELWTVFRNLDAEYQKFHSKPTALKPNVVRTSLLPFLKNYQSHPSDRKVRPEDLDRRTNILNKWWCGLLELLDGKNGQSLSGTDRPVILDAIIGLMERTEWRLSTAPFASLERKLSNSNSRTESSTSLSSEGSDFLTESVHHNVRNTFTQNLISQMSFVVEKMCQRTAPASLVAFCGKTCAYAFFFCPGVAEILVRLWNPVMDLLHRVVSECGIARSANLTETSKRMADLFPTSLSSLQFTTLSATYRNLRKPAPVPIGTHHLPWNGQWVSRWTGKDSDLFYIFAKYYYQLVVEYLPPDATRLERLCAPGIIFVNAQLLANLDATVHRHVAPTPMMDTDGPSNITFDDVLSDPDSTAPPLALSLMSNAARMMSENRLVMLVRDVLNGTNSCPDMVRQMFAECFGDLLKAVARKTSIYDQNACYTLCDLLEETITLLARYESQGTSVLSRLDWSFWFDVWQKMILSDNTSTEIRLYTLLYTLWTPIAAEPERRRKLCLTFLLDERFFQSRFNHWCPMVRAYFMRLLCWRVARFDGDLHECELEILDTLQARLNMTYGYYLYQRQIAGHSYIVPPSTAPCNPAPGKRLVIVRTDSPLAGPRHNGVPLISFDGIFSQPMSSSYKRNSNSDSFGTLELRPLSGGSSGTSDSDADADEVAGKKWGLLRTIIGPSKNRGKSRSPNRAAVNGVSTANGVRITHVQPDTKSDQPTHRPFSFKFTLDSIDRFDRGMRQPGAMRLGVPRLPVPARKNMLRLRGQNEGDRPEVESAEPRSVEEKRWSTYSGRALAEWMLVIGECQSFFERRRSEGVPDYRWVETPVLGVEAFRKVGA